MAGSGVVIGCVVGVILVFAFIIIYVSGRRSQNAVTPLDSPPSYAAETPWQTTSFATPTDTRVMDVDIERPPP